MERIQWGRVGVPVGSAEKIAIASARAETGAGADNEGDGQRLLNDLRLSLILLLVLLAVGVVGYRFLEGWEFIDSLYFASATLTTVGYGDVVPKTFYGKLFTVFYIWCGIPIGFFVIYSLMRYRRGTVDKHVGRIVRGMRGRR